MKLKHIFLVIFGLISGLGEAQEICMETRQNDDALIKDLYLKNGIYYITVDIVQFEESEFGEIKVKNENPKLRTFIIAPETTWELCFSKIGTLKIQEIAKRNYLIIDTYFQFSADNGKIVYSFHHSCSN
jgi:hypothetical protein